MVDLLYHKLLKIRKYISKLNKHWDFKPSGILHQVHVNIISKKIGYEEGIKWHRW